MAMADIVRQVAKEQWGLKGIRTVASVTTECGSRLFWVDTEAGNRYAVKRFYDDCSECPESVESSCRFSNEINTILAKKAGNNIRLSRFLPLLQECNGFEYVHRGFVCSTFIKNSRDLSCAQKCKENRLSCEEVRHHMANAFGTLHGFTSEARRCLNQAETFPLKSLEDQLKMLSRTDDILVRLVLKDFDEHLTEYVRRIEKLPQYPGFCHTSAEDFVISKRSGCITILNTHLLLRLTRLWDLSSLLLIDEYCTGFGKNEDDCQWMAKFAASLSTYFDKLRSGSYYAGKEHRFSDEEIEMFTVVLQIKLATQAESFQ